jgi:ribosomal-protein-alanine N-acetyltransferase
MVGRKRARSGLRPCQTPLSPDGGAAGTPARVEAAHPRELAALIELDRACFGRRAWPPAGWIEAVTEPGWSTLVVRVGGDPVAAMVVLPLTPVAHLASIAVHPARRGRGIGTVLLREALVRARAAGARFVALEVDRANRGALRLYRREGFGVVRRFREDGRWRLGMHRRLGGVKAPTSRRRRGEDGWGVSWRWW